MTHTAITPGERNKLIASLLAFATTVAAQVWLDAANEFVSHHSEDTAIDRNYVVAWLRERATLRPASRPSDRGQG